jgi:hypothetical protein
MGKLVLDRTGRGANFINRFNQVGAILDESAYSKETILKVVNILHEKFQVGVYTDFVLIVGGVASHACTANL